MPVWQADSKASAEAIARQFLAAQTPGVDVSEAGAIVTNSYTTKHNGVQHVYLRQRIAGLPVTNAVANVNIRSGRILSAYSRFYTGAFAGLMDELTRPRLTAERVAHRLARYLNVVISGPTKGAAEGQQRRATHRQALTLRKRLRLHATTHSGGRWQRLHADCAGPLAGRHSCRA